jgi:hypothetical protein
MAELLDITSEAYHGDPADTPSLNSSTARLLLTATPAHAKAQHPRLADLPIRQRTSKAMDIGTAVHQLLLKDDRVDVADDYADFRTNEAKAWRDLVRAQGRIPMLRHEWDAANEVADALRERMLELPKPTPFTAGTPEATIIYRDRGAVCRARLDWLRDDLTLIDDLKITTRTASPSKWQRTIFDLGYDVQAAMYVRAVVAMWATQNPLMDDLESPRFRWVVAEAYPPYAVTTVELSEQAMYAARVKVDTAIQIWRECLETGEWPAYSRETFIAETPGWQRDTSDAWADVDIDAVPF